MTDHAAIVAKPRRIARLMRKRGWNYRTPDNGLRRRAYDLASCHYRWWDWGHRLMILTGSDFGGNWQEPRPPTWWVHRLPTKPMRFTKYPMRRYEIVTDYDEMRERTRGLDEDGMCDWDAICVDSNGELVTGKRYWGGPPPYGMDSQQARILARYLRMWRRHDWYGARSWLHSQALHAAVHQKRPLSCGAVPPRGSGGYDHWHCQLKRNHDGVHRFNLYTWGHVVDGEPMGVVIHDGKPAA